MKLVTFTHGGSTRAGIHTASGDIGDFGISMRDLLEAGNLASQKPVGTIPASGAKIGAPVPDPRRVIAIGLNYKDHAAEANQQIPQRPIVFTKSTRCVAGPGEPVYMPRMSRAVDWEAELVIVIGAEARYVKAPDAEKYVAGYCCGNDVSVRDWQFHTPTWVMGKSFDTHGPIGPWLVTPDEVDVNNLGVRCFVNGEAKQSSNTNQLIFGVGEILEYVTSMMTLEPGDLIFTGTPAGVGGTRQPPQFLKAGDTVRVEIDGLGVLENPVAEEPS